MFHQQKPKSLRADLELESGRVDSWDQVGAVEEIEVEYSGSEWYARQPTLKP